MSLYHKYRPTSLDEVVGSEDVVDAVRSELQKDDPSRAFLFKGPTGCGKTTLGRIIANELGCKGSDFREVDSADFRGIDTIREIRKQSSFQPLESDCKVWILDECHKLSNDAQNALLKALENPSRSCFYILCTTEPQKLISTIRGRCSQYQVRQLGEKETLRLIRKVVKAEGESLNREVYKAVYESSQGHPRNALQILDQVIAADPDRRLEIAQKGDVAQPEINKLCQTLLAGGPWKKIQNTLNELKDRQEPENVRRAVLGYCSTVLLNNENDQAAAVMEEFISPFYDVGFPGLVFACYSVVKGE